LNEPADVGRRHSRILRFTLADGRPDPGSRKVIIEWDSNGHNGATMAFGNDGLLFVPSGDGTSGGDTDLAGQNTRLLRSNVLRIDVDTAGGTLAKRST
jgi:glucose/arabinose dehydrogenase